MAHPEAVTRVQGAGQFRGTKARGDGEAGSKNLDKWQDGRLLRHLGGLCGLRARLLQAETNKRHPSFFVIPYAGQFG